MQLLRIILMMRDLRMILMLLKWRKLMVLAWMESRNLRSIPLEVCRLKGLMRISMNILMHSWSHCLMMVNYILISVKLLLLLKICLRIMLNIWWRHPNHLLTRCIHTWKMCLMRWVIFLRHIWRMSTCHVHGTTWSEGRLGVLLSLGIKISAIASASEAWLAVEWRISLN